MNEDPRQDQRQSPSTQGDDQQDQNPLNQRPEAANRQSQDDAIERPRQSQGDGTQRKIQDGDDTPEDNDE